MEYYIRNKKRNISPILCGENIYPIIISNIGISKKDSSIDEELRKADLAIKAGASIINDNSLEGDFWNNYRLFLSALPVPFATVGINSLANKINSHVNIFQKEFVDTIIRQIEMGVDVITLHATIFKNDIEILKKSNRIIPCTSRGGLLMLKYMNKNNVENPFWLYFDNILHYAKKYNTTISLSTSYRPASVYDCSLQNDLYWIEIQRIAKLVEKAKEKNVNIMVEGIGHCPIDLIPSIISKTKKICYNVPYRVLTVSTDIALGHDHISSAISTAIAVEYGADIVTCVTRAEHIGLPSKEEIYESVISSKIAIHSGYIARTKDYTKDIRMTMARKEKGCIGEINAAIDPFSAKENICKHKYHDKKKQCEMCGNNCSLDLLDTLIYK